MLAHFHNPAAGGMGLPGPPLRGWRPDGWQAQKHLAGSTRYDLELCTVNLRAAGPGQVFLVAQVAWGADAASAARAAYSEIARVLQDQGLTIVHERLFREPGGQDRRSWPPGMQPSGPQTFPPTAP